MSNREIEDYVLLNRHNLRELGLQIAEAVHDGWTFLNKKGIQQQGDTYLGNTYYVEMIKYEPDQVVQEHLEQARQGMGVNISNLTPAQRVQFEERNNEMLVTGTRRSAFMNMDTVSPETLEAIRTGGWTENVIDPDEDEDGMNENQLQRIGID